MKQRSLPEFFCSVLEQDDTPIVICDTAHTIVYMNPAAIRRYEKAGGASMVGRSILDCHGGRGREMIEKTLAWFRESKEHNTVFESHNPQENKDVYMVALRDAEGTLMGYYEKHLYRDAETGARYDFSTAGRGGK